MDTTTPNLLQTLLAEWSTRRPGRGGMFARFQPRGCVAEVLASELRRAEALAAAGALSTSAPIAAVASTLAHFERERPRLSSRYPALWAGVLPLLNTLTTEAK